jgi:hypothetical protein
MLLEDLNMLEEARVAPASIPLPVSHLSNLDAPSTLDSSVPRPEYSPLDTLLSPNPSISSPTPSELSDIISQITHPYDPDPLSDFYIG